MSPMSQVPTPYRVVLGRDSESWRQGGDMISVDRNSKRELPTVMGHSTIQMTFDLYGHLFEDREADAEAMKKLEAAIVAA